MKSEPTLITPGSPEAAVVQALTEAAMAPAPITIALPHGNLPAIAVSERVNLHNLGHLLPAPLRASGTVDLLTLKDLHGYLSRQTAFENSRLNPVVYADRANLRFTAILNHHHQSGPGWMDYRAIVTLKKSRQLQIWQKQNATKMTQEAFALFLEEHLEDIRDPAGAEVLTFAETLEATRTEVFKSSIVTASGEMNLAYSSERNGEQSSKLITKITLGIPLFEGGEAFAVEVKISHRVSEGKLTFWFDLRHIDYLLDTAWADQTQFLEQTLSDIAVIYNGTAPLAQSLPSLSEGGSL